MQPFKTDRHAETAKSIISTNESPDISFDQSINPYRGCEHGCIYCYARPNHAYLGLSPGLDFETKLFVKVNAAELAGEGILQAPLSSRTIIDGRRHRHLSADRARLWRDALAARSDGALAPSGRAHHQVAARPARHRHSRAHGRARPGQGGDLRHHARPPHRARDGAARGRAAPAHRGHSHAGAGGRSRSR